MAVMKSDVSAGSDEYRRNRKVYDERIAICGRAARPQPLVVRSARGGCTRSANSCCRASASRR
jgi:hypothetical protein